MTLAEYAQMYLFSMRKERNPSQRKKHLWPQNLSRLWSASHSNGILFPSLCLKQNPRAQAFFLKKKSESPPLLVLAFELIFPSPQSLPRFFPCYFSFSVAHGKVPLVWLTTFGDGTGVPKGFQTATASSCLSLPSVWKDMFTSWILVLLYKDWWIFPLKQKS